MSGDEGDEGLSERCRSESGDSVRRLYLVRGGGTDKVSNVVKMMIFLLFFLCLIFGFA